MCAYVKDSIKANMKLLHTVVRTTFFNTSNLTEVIHKTKENVNLQIF